MVFPTVQVPAVISEWYINISAKDNRGNNKYVISRARGIQVLLKIWSDDAKTAPAKSRFTLKVYYKDLIEEVIADTVDDGAIIEDLKPFPVKYELVIYEKGVRVEGVIRYF